MKRLSSVIILSILCLSMFSMLGPLMINVSAISPPGMVNEIVTYGSRTYELLLWGNPLIDGFPDASVTAFKIYKDGSLLTTVDWTICRYRDYNPVSGWCQYAVSAVNAAGEGPQKTYWDYYGTMPLDYYDLTLYCNPPQAGFIAGLAVQTLRSGQTTAGKSGMPAMVTAHTAPNYNFTGQWTKTGSISINYYYPQPICYITDWWGNDAAITAYFQQLPVHDVTIGAHCNTEGMDVSVPITMDGSSTGYNTPHVFTGLVGSHTFTVANTDSSGHPLTQWSTGETTTTITVTEGGTYVAYYQAPSPTPYDVTVYAYCSSEGKDLAVSIAQDGMPIEFSTPHFFNDLTGTHSFSVPSSDANDHPFKQWSTGQTSPTIYVSSDGAYTAYYQATPPPTHYVTISAYDKTQGTAVCVAITEDGSPSGFYTPHTFLGLTGTHAFAVPSGDAYGDPFKSWNTGTLVNSISVSSTGSHMAYYEAQAPPAATKIQVTPASSAVGILSSILFSGKVTDQYGNGVYGVTVGIDDPLAQLSTSRTTNANGDFTYSTTAAMSGAFLVSFSVGEMRTFSIVNVGIAPQFSAFPQVSVRNINDFPITAVVSLNSEEKFRVNVPMDETTTLVEFEGYEPSIISGAIESCPVQMGAGQLCMDSQGVISGQVGEGIIVGAYKKVTTEEFGACGGAGGGVPYTVWGDGLICVGTDGINLQLSAGLVAIGGSIEIRILSFQESNVGRFSGHSPVSLLVINQTGKRVGFDPSTGLVNEVDWASYTGPSTDPQVIYIPSPVAGSYILNIFGLEDGNCSISIENLLANGLTVSAQWINGTITKGETLVAVVQDGLALYSTRVVPARSVVGKGYDLPINVTITNIASLTETFNITASVNSTEIGTVTEINVQNGTSTTLTFNWNTQSVAYGPYIISACAELVSPQANIASSTATRGPVRVTILGDVDGDRNVDIFDIVLMAGGYGTKPPNPKYLPDCDIDGDGDIDIFDLVAAAGNYGKSW